MLNSISFSIQQASFFKKKRDALKKKGIRATDLVLVVCRDSKTKQIEIINE